MRWSRRNLSLINVVRADDEAALTAVLHGDLERADIERKTAAGPLATSLSAETALRQTDGPQTAAQTLLRGKRASDSFPASGRVVQSTLRPETIQAQTEYRAAFADAHQIVWFGLGLSVLLAGYYPVIVHDVMHGRK